VSIAAALAATQERIAHAAARAGRDPTDVTLIAVSKTFPADAVREALAAGQRVFGENRVEEALPKRDAVGAQPGLAWHLIGHLQSRKARDAAGAFALIHSVDSLRLAHKIAERVATGRQPILLQCNVSGEASKEGFDLAGWEHDASKLAAFVETAAQIAALPGIEVRGLMTIAPISAAPGEARPVFASLRALREVLTERMPHAVWHELSMGMSDDLDDAVGEGATLVRVGRAIFGTRT
jgi:PLP dependent protein